MMALGQKKRFLFFLRVLVFPADSQVIVIPSRIREGVSHMSGRAPSVGSFFAGERSRRVGLRSNVGDDIGDLTRSLGRSRDLVGMFKAE